jgi:tRNA modification GTPase
MQVPFRKTLIALATPPGLGALAIIRLTGPDTYAIVEKLTHKQRGVLKPRKAVLTPFYDDQNRAVDEGFLLPFFGPRSYTGEDLCELYIHGNPQISRILIETALRHGAHPADPGAFTRRAVLSGRMGLLEVESLAELMSALTPQGAEGALRRLHGAVREFILPIRRELIELRAQWEAGLDFPEEGIEPETQIRLKERCERIADLLEGAVRSARKARVLCYGATVVIAGAPNVGKSTLLNALLRERRAITSPIPGTTRDYLEAFATIGSVPIRLLDTAGVRESEDPLEAEGIARAKEKITSADLVLWLRSPIDPEDRSLGDLFATFPRDRLLILWNKRDLAPPPEAGDLVLSALDPRDIETLKQRIAERLLPGEGESPILSTVRQEEHARGALRALRRLIAHLENSAPEEILLSELNTCQRELAYLMGEIDPEEVLEEIFSRFCIGK